MEVFTSGQQTDPQACFLTPHATCSRLSTLLNLQHQLLPLTLHRYGAPPPTGVLSKEGIRKNDHCKPSDPLPESGPMQNIMTAITKDDGFYRQPPKSCSVGLFKSHPKITRVCKS